MEVDKVTTFKIYVGNLPDETQDDEIRKIFEEFGTVVQCECVGKKAFVHMEDDIEGKHAVGQLQGRELNGNTLTIQEARNNELPRIPTVKLLVKNISSTVDARGLRNMFKRFGYVLEVQVENGEGHVCLEAIGDIRSAITDMNGFKIDDQELAVEPAPIPVTTEEEEPEEEEPESDPGSSSHTKYRNSPNKKNKGYSSSWDSWSRAKQQYYESEEYRNDSYSGHGSYGYDSYDSPWVNPPHSPYNRQPERILRDPHLRQRGHHSHMGGPPPGGRGFRGHMGSRPHMGPRVLLPPPIPPSHFPPPSMGGMPARVMRSTLQPRGHPSRGGPRPQFRNGPRGGGEPQFYRRNEHNNPWEEESEQQDFEEPVFYEDDPISLISRSRHQANRSVSGANSIPIGGGGMGPGPSRSNFPPQRNGNGNSWGGGPRRGGGRGRGRGPKFTAVTEEVSPGEKYPVPPIHNPGFQAPLKRPKEEQVRRKTKKKKQPLVPAELPDYSVPVPQLSQQSVPRGAVFKPFPPPQSNSVIDSDSFGGGGGSESFFDHNEDSSHMDFTTDDIV